MGDGAQQVHFLPPLAFAVCVPCRPRLPRAGPGGGRVAGGGGREPRVAGSGPHPAVRPGQAQRLGGAAYRAASSSPACRLARRGARGDPAREPRVQRRGRQARGQRGLQLIGIQQCLEPAQRGRGRRLMGAGPAGCGGSRARPARPGPSPPPPRRSPAGRSARTPRPLPAPTPASPASAGSRAAYAGSVSRTASTSRSAAGSGGAPAAPRWQRTTSISDDAYTGTALPRIIRTSTPK